MGKPSRTRDAVGAVLLVLVGILYMSGITDATIERGVKSNADAPTEIMEVSTPVPHAAYPAWIS